MSLRGKRVDSLMIGLVVALVVTISAGLGYYGGKSGSGSAQEGGASVEDEVSSNEALERKAFEKIRMVEPHLTLNQVRVSDLYPGLVEIYHEGKLRYILGDLVIRGDLIDVSTGENLTRKTLNALRGLEGKSEGDSLNVASATPPESRDPAEQVESAPERQTQAENRAALSDESSEQSGKEVPGGLNAALAILANDIIPDEMTVVYPAQGEQKYLVTVFSDITCPVCQRNHKDYETFQERGVTLRAALFPRRGMEAGEAEVMSKVLCAPTMEERRDLLDRAYEGDPLEDAQMCENGYLQNIRDIAVAQKSGLAITSTPTLMSANGLRVDGYPRENPVATIMQMLQERGSVRN